MSGRRPMVCVRRRAPNFRVPQPTDRDGFVEEEPNVPTVARARSLQSCWRIHLAKGFQKRGGSTTLFYIGLSAKLQAQSKTVPAPLVQMHPARRLRLTIENAPPKRLPAVD